MTSTVLIALVDKPWPPDHSFVRGMLAQVVASQPDIKVRLVVSRDGAQYRPVRRFERAACWLGMAPRRHIWRFVNLFFVLKLGIYQLRRERKRGNKIVLFVRNDPIMLLAAALLRPWASRLIFQSSFPHELYSGGRVKKGFARLLYRLAGRRVDAVTGVNSLGVERVARYCPNAQKGPHIPLLSDFVINRAVGIPAKLDHEGLRFIYIGAHTPGREMGQVLASVVAALEEGSGSIFTFVGASNAEIDTLRSVGGVEYWISKGRVIFSGPVPRTEIPRLLCEADVGLSLIPPRPMYVESSPTKLAEYLGAGLLVLASKGIPMQEEFVKKSRAGVLVDWDVSAIVKGIRKLEQLSPAEFEQARQQWIEFAHQELSYKSYLSSFRSLIGLV